MKILMLSGDPHILEEGTEVRERMRQYAGLFDELHIIVSTSIKTAVVRTPPLFLYGASGNSFLRLFRMYHIARSLMQETKIGIVSAQGADEFGLIGFFLARRFRIPLQLQVHTDILSPWYRSASWKEWLRFRFARFLIPRADCLRVVSERTKRSLIESGIVKDASRIAILPIFTDISRFLDAIRDKKTDERFRHYTFKMIAVGRFAEKEKNFSMLIEMMRDFVMVCPGALLVLVGGGPDRKRYKESITDYKLGKNVILEEWRDDLPIFYKSFDLFLLSSNYEGWGMVVVEAMAAGLPVVMTDVGLAGEVVKNKENGVVVPVADRWAMCRAVTDLYQNHELRAKFSEAGFTTIKNLEPKSKGEYLQRYKQNFICCLQKF